MTLTILILVGLILFLTLIGIMLIKHFCNKKQQQVEIKSPEAISNNQHIDLGDQEVIPDSHQSQIHKQQNQVKSLKQSNTPSRKSKQKKEKQLMGEIAFYSSFTKDFVNKGNI